MKPTLIIIAGPSGVGKSTILESILPKFKEIKKLKTITTRPKRAGEGEKYYFTSEDDFKNLITSGDLIEWAQIHGHFYGAKKSEVEKMIKEGTYPIAAIDVQGVRKYKKIFPDLLAIFISYDSLAELPKRLRSTRPDASEEEIQKRLTTAQGEMKAVNEYEHVVLNHEGQLNKTIDTVVGIIEKELNIKSIQ